VRRLRLPARHRPPPVAGWAAWPWLARTTVLRRWAWRVVFGPLVRRCCHPLEVHGLEHLDAGRPTLIVANHGSHADTAVILATLGIRLRGRLVTAAATDYFFCSAGRALGSTLLVGALPFPRKGSVGLERVRYALDHGFSVLLFPQGSRDGGAFRSGAGTLTVAGIPVVPVGLSGCRRVLPKGRRWPGRAPVVVHIGAPITVTSTDAADAAHQLQAAVAALTDELRP
jgi:1-acyl-sn-glycerol-3-phosphate acyltransferase